MTDKRRVKILRSGRSQVVKIPREFELPGAEAILRKEGARLIIEPVRHRSLLDVISKFKPLKGSRSRITDKLAEPIDL
jgi:antitoxin VapB